jgi:hypothetical protein
MTYIHANRANWNSRAKCHHESSEVHETLAKLRCGQSTLKEIETNLLGIVLFRFQLALTNKRPLSPVRRGITLAPPAYFKMVIK